MDIASALMDSSAAAVELLARGADIEAQTQLDLASAAVYGVDATVW